MRSIKTLAACLAAALATAALSGCASMRHRGGGDERSEGRVVDDKNITKNVEKALKNEANYKFEGVTVDTFSGVVQLSGFVDAGDQKTRAGAIAAEVPGVLDVINGLAIKPERLTPTGRTAPPPATESHQP